MRRKLALVLLVTWIVAGVALGGVLLLRHTVALPAPPRTDPALRAAIAEVLPPSGGRLRAVHVLYRGCPCAARLTAHLTARRAHPGVDELVLFTDDENRPAPTDDALRGAGFRVQVITPSELRARFGIEATPLLVVALPDGALAYAGGYNRRKQAPRYEDAAILAEAARRADPRAALPIFGCPTSARLAAALDPLGLAPGPGAGAP